jgi:hypothetical protein
VWTLRQVPGVTGVRMTVNGQPVIVPAVGPVQPIGAWPDVDPDAMPASSHGWAVDPKRGLLQLAPDGTPTVVKVKPDLGRFAVSLDGLQVAGVATEKKAQAVYVGKLGEAQPLVKRYVGTDISRPSWDRYGTVWFVDHLKGLVTVSGDTVAQVPLTGFPPGVTDKSLLTVAVSRDGTRLAMTVKRGTVVEPLVARIERDGDTVRVAEPRRLIGAITDASDIAWQDADTLAVLGTSGASSLEVHQLPLGYGSNPPHTSAPPDAVTLAAAPDRPLLVGTSPTSTTTGASATAVAKVFSNAGSIWSAVVEAFYPTYPG